MKKLDAPLDCMEHKIDNSNKYLGDKIENIENRVKKNDKFHRRELENLRNEIESNNETIEENVTQKVIDEITPHIDEIQEKITADLTQIIQEELYTDKLKFTITDNLKTFVKNEVDKKTREENYQDQTITDEDIRKIIREEIAEIIVESNETRGKKRK